MKYVIIPVVVCVLCGIALYIPFASVRPVDGVYIGFFSTDDNASALALGLETFGCDATTSHGIAFTGGMNADGSMLLSVQGMHVVSRLKNDLLPCAPIRGSTFTPLPLPDPLPAELDITIVLNNQRNRFHLTADNEELALDDLEETNVVLPDSPKHALAQRSTQRSRYVR